MHHVFRKPRVKGPLRLSEILLGGIRRGGRRLAGSGSVAVLLAGLAMPEPAEARVRILVRPDGTKVIFDEAQKRSTASVSGSLLPVSRSEIGDLIDYYANEEGLNPRLVQAVIQIESAYNPRARSRKGAMGLMQLMPETARELRVSDAYDPGENIRGGTRYLRRQLDRFSGDLTLALAAYNAGPGAVTQYGGVPPYSETRNYVRKVLSLYRGRSAGGFERAPRPTPQGQTAAVDSPAPPVREPGQKVYMSRGGNNRIVFTTARPKSR